MRTLIVSDLHLGSPVRADVLRDPERRSSLLQAAGDADRVVLLGDLLELRDSAPEHAIEAARPFLEDLGGALAGSQVTIVAGNHDHGLVRGWLACERRPRPLQLDGRVDVESTPVLAQLARCVRPARLEVFYPGVWVREDVYATHGHYLDCHMGLTSGERMMISALSRRPGRSRSGPQSIDEYESVTGPVYARLDAHAQLRRFAYSRVAARLGRLLAGLSHEQLVRAERSAMGEVAARLGLGEAYVVFGHTHRPGPFVEDDDPQRWRGRLGARLVNCGCWLVHAMRAQDASGAEVWRAPCVVVQDGEAPRVLLLDVPLSAAQRSEQAP